MEQCDVVFPDVSNNVVLEVRADPPHGTYIGSCKWFNNKLGYGFIRVCTGEYKGCDLFVHHTGLKPLNSSFKTMYKGEYVHFNISDGRNGKQAVDVTGINGGPLMCDNVSQAHIRATSPVPDQNRGGWRGRSFTGYRGGYRGGRVSPLPHFATVESNSSSSI
jgi:cold shock CspA family protein